MEELIIIETKKGTVYIITDYITGTYIDKNLTYEEEEELIKKFDNYQENQKKNQVIISFLWETILQKKLHNRIFWLSQREKRRKNG